MITRTQRNKSTVALILFSFSRSTILVQMKTDGNEEQLYQPGDHLAVFAENSSELVSAVIGLIDNAPGVDEPLKMEICKETSGTIVWGSHI